MIKTYKVNIALPGVLDYGSMGLLHRTHETLIADCKSLVGKAFTMMHPKTEAATKVLKVGKVVDISVNDVGFSGTIEVSDRLAQNLIDSKTAIEVSPCYNAKISEVETIIDGKTCRGEQTKIWGFKHLALVEAGRGGAACAVITDSEKDGGFTAEFKDSYSAEFELVEPTVVANIIKDSKTATTSEVKDTVDDPEQKGNTEDFTKVRNFLCVVLDGITDAERQATNLDEFAKSYISRTMDATIVMDGLSTSEMLSAFTIDRYYKNKQIEAEVEAKTRLVEDSKPATKTPTPEIKSPPKPPANNFPQFFSKA
jgi:hypothetical protein